MPKKGSRRLVRCLAASFYQCRKQRRDTIVQTSARKTRTDKTQAVLLRCRMSNRTLQLVPHISSGAEKLGRGETPLKKRNPAEKLGGTRLCCIRHVEECPLGMLPVAAGRRRHFRLFIIIVIPIFIMIIVLRGGSAARVHYTISPQPHPLLSNTFSPPPSPSVGGTVATSRERRLCNANASKSLL